MSNPLQPLVADIYSKEPLQRDQIRLLTVLPKAEGEKDYAPLRCLLRTVDLTAGSPPSYTALSYTWGHDSDRLNIEVNGQCFKATRNLQSALKHFRNTQHPIPTLWVDAICINQNHHGEKGEQVKLMQSIFKGANETWVWLGPEANESNKAVDLINDLSHVYLNSCKDGHTEPEDANKGFWGTLKSRGIEEHLIAFDHFLTREYWYRIWVVQEIALSKNLILFCGRRKFFWQSLIYTAYLLDAQVETRQIINSYNHDRDPFRGVLGGLQRIFLIQSVRNDFQKKDLASELKDSLLSLLSNHRATGASEPKDKYIALAGLVSEEDAEETNHEIKEARSDLEDLAAKDPYHTSITVGDIYTLGCKKLVGEPRHRPLDFLDSAGPPRNYDMPSWVPDWSSNDGRAIPLLYWQLPTKQHKDLSAINAPGKGRKTNKTTFAFDGKSLKAWGIVFDTVKASNSDPDPSTDPPTSRSAQLSEYPTGGLLTEALWRTFVLNKADTNGREAPQNWEYVFYRLVRSAGSSFVHRWFNNCKHIKFGGSTIEELAKGWWIPTVEQSAISEEEFARFKSAFTNAVGYRKLASTKAGYLGLVPFDAKAGDVVAVLADCSAPVLLRRDTEGPFYKFLGTCYVHGIMRGKAVDELKVEDPFTEQFEIR